MDPFQNEPDGSFNPNAPNNFEDDSWMDFLDGNEFQFQWQNAPLQADSNVAFAANTVNQNIQPQQQPVQSTNNQLQNTNYGWDNPDPTQRSAAQPSHAVVTQPSNPSYNAPMQSGSSGFGTNNNYAGPQFPAAGPNNTGYPQPHFNNTYQRTIAPLAATNASISTQSQPLNGPVTTIANRNVQQTQEAEPTAGGSTNEPASSTQPWKWEYLVNKETLDRTLREGNKDELKALSKEIRQKGVHVVPDLPDNFDVQDLQHRLQYTKSHADAIVESEPFAAVMMRIIAVQGNNSNAKTPKKRGKRKSPSRNDDVDDAEERAPKRQRKGNETVAEKEQTETQQGVLPQSQPQQLASSGTETMSLFPPQPTDLTSARDQQRQQRYQEYLRQQEQQQLQQQQSQMHPHWAPPYGSNPYAGPSTYPATISGPMAHPRFPSSGSNLSPAVPHQPQTPLHNLNRPFNAMQLQHPQTPQRYSAFGHVNPNGFNPYPPIPTPTAQPGAGVGLGLDTLPSTVSDPARAQWNQFQRAEDERRWRLDFQHQRGAFAHLRQAPASLPQASTQPQQQQQQQQLSAPQHTTSAQQHTTSAQQHPPAPVSQASAVMGSEPAPPAAPAPPPHPTPSGPKIHQGLFLPTNLRATTAAAPPNTTTTAEAGAPTPPLPTTAPAAPTTDPVAAPSASTAVAMPDARTGPQEPPNHRQPQHQHQQQDQQHQPQPGPQPSPARPGPDLRSPLRGVPRLPARIGRR